MSPNARSPFLSPPAQVSPLKENFDKYGRACACFANGGKH
jgi:hypothetical protein